MTERFDRTDTGRRIYFASAMTLLGYTDGASHTEGANYLELAEGSSPTATIRTGTWSSSGAGSYSISLFRTATTT